jgi:hypothetical protein
MTALLCLVGLFGKSNPLLFAGAALFIIDMAWQLVRYKNLKATLRKHAKE